MGSQEHAYQEGARMSQLALYLFGPPRLELDGVPVIFAHRKAIALLAYLAVSGQSHSRDALAALLWPESDQSSARGGLRRMLSEIKTTLGGGWLVTDRENTRFITNRDYSTGQSFWLDVIEFQRKRKVCESHHHPPTVTCPDCLPELEAAVELYRDDFMVGFSLKECQAYEEWQFFQREELRGQLTDALVRLSSHYAASLEYGTAIGYARRWLALDLLHEPAHRQLMVLYEQSGQRFAALRQYQVCRETLADELGVDPSGETKDLYQKIQASTLAVSRNLHLIHNLPEQTTPFIGRVNELVEIRAKLMDDDCRLLTLLGPGGSGKTRLAIEVAGQLLDDFKHGVFFVDLAPLQDADMIATTIATALTFSFSGDGAPEEQLLDYLKNKEMLLILDNFEQILDATEFIIPIMSVAPGVVILVTTRIRLMVTGENVYDVWGMAYPESLISMKIAIQQYSAIKLFESEASRVRGGFRLREDNLEDVIEVCSLLEGMPLGIVLAANWVTMLTPAEIAKEIARDFEFLNTKMRDLPRRQRGIRSAFNYSWHLLNEDERRVLGALSVFRGGFTQDAALEIADASIRDLKDLIDHSMLQRNSDGRYEMHELVRQYAAEKLAMNLETEADIKGKHSNYFCRALAVWGRQLQGPRQAAANREMKIEFGNIRTAWGWAVENLALKSLMDGINGLGVFFLYNRHPLEGEAACLSILERLETLGVSDPNKNGSGKKPPMVQIERCKLQARALAWGGLFHSDKETAHNLLQKCLSMLESYVLAAEDTRFEKAIAYCVLPWVLDFNSLSENIKMAEEGLQIFKSLDETWYVGEALGLLGHLANSLKDVEKQKSYREECLAVCRQQGDFRGIAEILVNLAWDELVEQAEEMIYEALAISTELDDRTNIVFAYTVLGCHWINQGKFKEARALYNDTLLNYGGLNFTRNDVSMIHAYAALPDLYLGDYLAVRRLAKNAIELFKEDKGYSVPYYAALVIDIQGRVTLAEESYAEAESKFQDCLNILQTQEVPASYSKTLAGLGFAARGLSQRSRAQACFYQALRVALQVAMNIKYGTLVHALSGIALLFADQGEVERAVALYALASTFGIVANSKWFADIAGDEIAKAAEELPPDVAEAAKVRGRQLDLWETAEELLMELEEMGWGSADQKVGPAESIAEQNAE
jgi:predicted ATPase/DNA-binding SARP family transcriptional activator